MVVQERESLLRVVLLEEGNLLRVVQSKLEEDVLLLMVREREIFVLRVLLEVGNLYRGEGGILLQVVIE